MSDVNPAPPTVTMVATRTRNWSSTDYLPTADAAFITALASLCSTAPGDVNVLYSATSGDAVQLRVLQTDRSVFVTGDDLPPQMPVSVLAQPIAGLVVSTDTLQVVGVIATALASAANASLSVVS